jgi:hypothetical protein
MNFLTVPRINVEEPDKDMTDERLEVAVQFTDELVKLGMIQLPPSPAQIKAIKPGQPGEWRILGDKKRGGQNEAIGQDPVYLNQPDTVLPHMYLADTVPSATRASSSINFQRQRKAAIT